MRLVAVALALFACEPARAPLPSEAAPGVVFPVHVAEGHGDGAPVDVAPMPSASASTSASPSASTAPTPAPSALPPAPDVTEGLSPPDPKPLRLSQQYEYSLIWKNHAVKVESVRAVQLARPIVTPRRIGRFAIELWIGRELVERVRFDFPLLAAEPLETGKRHALHEPPSFADATLRTKVLVPAAPRARRAVLLDRATGDQTPLAWPPPRAPATRAPATPAQGVTATAQ